MSLNPLALIFVVLILAGMLAFIAAYASVLAASSLYLVSSSLVTATNWGIGRGSPPGGKEQKAKNIRR